MMDANENVFDDTMVKLKAKSVIGLRAAVHSKTNNPGPKTHIGGSKSINNIFVTP